MLCWNKIKLLPNNYPRVYELQWTCKSFRFGWTKRNIFTQMIEHQKDSFTGKWDNTKAAEHTLMCHGQFS